MSGPVSLLPSGWKEIQLGKVAQLSGRIGWKGLTAKEYTKEGPLFLSVHSLNYGDYVDYRDAFHISQERYDESPEIMLRPDDVLICKDGAGIGKLGIVGEVPRETTINSSLLLVRAQESILPKYLYYILSSPYFQSIVQSRLMGATTPHLYQRDIAEFPIYLPPLPEQQRIVAILDETFGGLATATENAEKNLKNARELFDSHLSWVFGQNWEIQALGDISENLDSKRVPITKHHRKPGDIPYYGASGPVDSVAEFIFDEDLLLVSEDGANLVMRTYPIAFSIAGKSWVNNHAHVLRFPDLASQKFVEHYLNSISLMPYVSGMAQPKLNQKTLNSIAVPWPKQDERENVVARIEELAAQTDRLRELYEIRISALTELKQSILAKAFSGELTSRLSRVTKEAAE